MRRRTLYNIGMYYEIDDFLFILSFYDYCNQNFFVLQLAFDAVMVLWEHKILRSQGTNIAEKILSILCHLIKGEVTIREKLAKQKEKKQSTESEDKPSTASTTATTSNTATPVLAERTQRGVTISPAYVQQVCRNSLISLLVFYTRSP